MAVSLRFCIVRATTYKLNHYYKSTTKEACRDFYFPEEMYQGKRSIFLYKRPPLCFPQKTATLAVLPLFSGQAWPFNINNWAFNSINLLSVLLAKMLVFHWHLSTTGRRLNQTLSPPIDRFVHDQATHKVPAEIFGILQDNFTFLKFILLTY